MKRIVWLLLLAVVLPMTSFASEVQFTNSGGTLIGTSAGLSLFNSTLTAVGNITGANLGGVFFTTGALTSGSLQTGGIFAGGGAFQITGNGSSGVPNTLIFNGAFFGPVTWTLVTTNGTHDYTLSGMLSGTYFTGAAVNGTTKVETLNLGTGFFNGTTSVEKEDTTIAVPGVVPEPGTLILFGTGLLALAGVGVARRKLKA